MTNRHIWGNLGALALLWGRKDSRYIILDPAQRAASEGPRWTHGGGLSSATRPNRCNGTKKKEQ